MYALLAVGALALELNSPFLKETTQTFAIVAQADVNGTNHEATFTFVVQSQKKTENSIPAKLFWKELKVDGVEVGEDSEWSGKLDDSGQLLEIPAEGDDYRRMLMPLLFAYPNKLIEAASRFKIEWLKPTHEHFPTLESEFLGSEKVGDKSLAKIKTKLSEKSVNGVRADGTWWFEESGKLTKFELDVKNWIVPMAGGGPVGAKITGTAK